MSSLAEEFADAAAAMPGGDFARLSADDLAAGRAEDAAASEVACPSEILIKDVVIAGAAGGELLLRIYRPQDEADPAASLLYFHGGAFCAGSPAGEDKRGIWLCRRAGVRVISVDYRLAPEHPYPAGLEDAYAALNWVARTAPAVRRRGKLTPGRQGKLTP